MSMSWSQPAGAARTKGNRSGAQYREIAARRCEAGVRFAGSVMVAASGLGAGACRGGASCKLH